MHRGRHRVSADPRRSCWREGHTVYRKYRRWSRWRSSRYRRLDLRNEREVIAYLHGDQALIVVRGIRIHEFLRVAHLGDHVGVKRECRIGAETGMGDDAFHGSEPIDSLDDCRVIQVVHVEENSPVVLAWIV